VTGDFENVVRENTDRIYGLCFRLTGEASEAEDLCQETFMKAFKAWDRFEGRSQPSTWLYRIAVNSWKNRLRGKKLKFFSLFATKNDDDKPMDWEGNDPLPEHPLEKEDKQTHFQQAMRTLDGNDRLIITLRDLEDKSYAEIGEMLNLPIGTVRSRLSRAREKLRDKLIPFLKSIGEFHD